MNYEIADQKVAVDIPDDIMKSIIITTGPRFNKSLSMEEFKGIEDIRSSIFAGKLNYVYCDRCKG